MSGRTGPGGPDLPPYLQEPAPEPPPIDPPVPGPDLDASEVVTERRMSRSNRLRVTAARVGLSSLGLVFVAVQAIWMQTERHALSPWVFLVIGIGFVLLLPFSVWSTYQRLGHIVLRLTERGIYVGSDDGRSLGWASHYPQRIAWTTVTDVRIVETHWSRTIMVLTTGFPVVLLFPRSTGPIPEPELDAVADEIRRVWRSRAASIPSPTGATPPPPPSGRPVVGDR